MHDTAPTRAADYVARCRLRREKLARFPQAWGITGIENAYAVQMLANEILAEHLGPPRGLKIGGTTKVMREMINVPEPLLGEVFDSTVHENGVVLSLGEFQRAGIESEIAAELAKPLEPDNAPSSREEAADFVAALMPAIEIVDDRYVDFKTVGAEVQIVDNVFNAASVLGPPVKEWRHLALDRLGCRTVIDGVEVATGTSDALMDHPLDALLFALQRWAGLGRGLPAGSFISLGTITPVQWHHGVCQVEIEGLGGVALTLA
ncbi:MAG: fumarylacetoacetate hydrolase family protein [Pseudomonadota bacterium]